MRRLHERLSPFGKQVLKELLTHPDDFFLFNRESATKHDRLGHKYFGGFDLVGRWRLRHVIIPRGDKIGHEIYSAGVPCRRVLPLLDQMFLRVQLKRWARREVDVSALAQLGDGRISAQGSLSGRVSVSAGIPPSIIRQMAEHARNQIDKAVLDSLVAKANPALVVRDDQLDALKLNYDLGFGVAKVNSDARLMKNDGA